MSSKVNNALSAIADAVRDADESMGWTVYALIDPTLGDPLPAMGVDGRDRFPLPIKPALMSAYHRPYLVQLGDMGRDLLLEATVQRAVEEVEGGHGHVAGARSVCAWLAAKESPRDLAQALANRARVTVGSGPRLFRYWDPRVMDLLPAFMGALELQRLLSPINLWCWISPGACVEVLTFEDSCRTMRDMWVEQPERFLYLGQISKALTLLKDDQGCSPAVDLLRLDQGIRDGKTCWGLASEYEIVTYALHWILFGSGFDEDMQVRQIMQSAVSRGISPVSSLEELNEEFWSSVISRRGRAMQGAKNGS